MQLLRFLAGAVKGCVKFVATCLQILIWSVLLCLVIFAEFIVRGLQIIGAVRGVDGTTILQEDHAPSAQTMVEMGSTEDISCIVLRTPFMVVNIRIFGKRSISNKSSE